MRVSSEVPGGRTASTKKFDIISITKKLFGGGRLSKRSDQKDE
jgi:hypothetical protein